jgi:hypothetical protein
MSAFAKSAKVVGVGITKSAAGYALKVNISRTRHQALLFRKKSMAFP